MKLNIEWIYSRTDAYNDRSSNVAAVGYDAGNQTVYVQDCIYGRVSTIAYKGVAEHEFENLRTASSVESYLNSKFKNVYPYERVRWDHSI